MGLSEELLIYLRRRPIREELTNLTTRSKRVFGKELLEKMGKSRRSSLRMQLLGLRIAWFYDDLDSDSLPKYNIFVRNN